MDTVNLSNHPSLCELFKDDFYLGVALGNSQIMGKEPYSLEVAAKHFNSITPENDMKWESIHPEPDRYDFDAADRYVAFGEKHNMHIISHTLVWFYQTPDWVFQDEFGKPLSRDRLIQRMKDHIFTIMGRYKGRIHGWDVVNEAMVPGEKFRPCKWLDIIGEEYVSMAFEFARQADPDAQLYYNDYFLWKPDMLKGVVRLVQNLQSKGLRVDGVGSQGHWSLEHPGFDQIENFIAALGNLNLKTMITEMDISVLPHVEDYMDKQISSLDPELQKRLDPYTASVPDSALQQQAKRYVELFDLFRKHRNNIGRVTFWGLHDAQSWRGNWPILGRTDYPLLFDHQCQPKPAFNAIANAFNS